MKLTLRSKLSLAAAIPLVLAATFGLVFGQINMRRSATEESKQRVQLIADYYAARFDGQFNVITQMVKDVAALATSGKCNDEDELFNALRTVLNQQPLVYGSCIAFEPEAFQTGRARFAPYVCRDAKDGLRAIDLSKAYDYMDGQWEWYSAPRESRQPVWTEPYFDEGAGNIIMCTFSLPLIRDGEFIGVVTADIALDQLYQWFSLSALKGGSFVVVSHKGMFISAQDPTTVGRVSLADVQRNAGRADVDDLARAIDAGERDTRLMDNFPQPGRHFLAHSPVPSTGWSFVAATSEADVMGPVFTELRWRAFFFVLVTAATLYVIFYVTRRTTKPIEQLSTSVKQLGTGEFDVASLDIPARDELGDLARAFTKMVIDLREHVEARTREVASRERIESELRVARDIQSSLIPSGFPPFPDHKEFNLAGLNLAARHVAGDFFDYFFVSPDRLFFIIADVSGKGIPAAMFMAVSRTVLRQLAENYEHPSPARILTEANRLLLRDNDRGMFLTLFLGIYNISTGELVYSNAGHPPPYLVRSGSPATAFGDLNGTLVGVIDEAAYNESRATLQPGERLVLYTDGVTEAVAHDPRDIHAPALRTDKKNRLFGDQRTADLITSVAHLPVDEMCKAIAKAIDDYQAHDPADDVTILILERTT
ncbi:MAG TPA: SpoIIE family protein phosphatase [Phycisphaerales bacterium]|nr:SpoIIE family protein phosphatase [Phycisphaerales bacterium]